MLESPSKNTPPVPSRRLSLDVMHFLKNWLVNHIQGSDQSYRAHLNSKGIH